jgi:hypothetical protein
MVAMTFASCGAGSRSPRLVAHELAGRAWIGLAEHLILSKDGRVLEVSNLDPEVFPAPLTGLRGGGRIELPEPAVQVASFAGVGWVVRTAGGTVYATGLSRPGPETDLGRVPLPGPATEVVNACGRVCAAIRSSGVWCWDGLPDERSEDPPPQRLRGGPRDATAIACAWPGICATDAAGDMYCWRLRGATRFGRAHRVARHVRWLAKAEMGPFGYVGGERTRGGGRLYSFIQSSSDTNVRPRSVAILDGVTALDGGMGSLCAIAGNNLYCWGMTSPFGGWLNVGPEGIDPRTVPDGARVLVFIQRPRWVMRVPPGTQIAMLGLSMCLLFPGSTRLECDPIVGSTSLEAQGLATRLPLGRHRYRGDDAYH